jgi:putative restriction endonuclease
LERDEFAPSSLGTADEPGSSAPRQSTTIQRIVRNSAIGQRVKQLHDFRCQVCGIQLATAAGPYIEAAHIRPLGRPHDGPDHEGNILILCPNHHALFDFGALAVSETFQVRNTLTGAILGTLRRVPRHDIDPGALAYHYEHIAGLSPELLGVDA